MGLVIPAEMPAPAAPPESEADLAHLFGFANQSKVYFLSLCSAPRWNGDGAIERRDLHAFYLLLNACDEQARGEMRALADEAIATGREKEEFQRLLDEYNASEELARRALKSMPPPGTFADAEFQGWMISRLVGSRLSTVNVAPLYSSYQHGMGYSFNELNLDNSFINLAAARRDMDGLAHMVSRYQWQSGSCHLPTFEDESRWALHRLNRTLAMAESTIDGTPEHYNDPGYINNLHGYVLRVLEPKVQFTVEDGLLLGLVWERDSLNFHHAFWENVTAGAALPTKEEANYLLHLQKSKVNALSTKQRWDNEHYAVNRYMAEELMDPPEFLRPVAMQAITWGFADLNCTGPL